MIDKYLAQRIERFGLTQREALAYLALLSFGSASAKDVATESNLNRSSTYVLLESLVKKGFASISVKDSNRLYISSPPERLVQALEDDAKIAAERLGEAQSILPELKSIFSCVGPKPKVTFYEGAQGIETVYEDTLASSETILAYASIENMHAALPHYFPDYYKRRAAKGIDIRSIHPDTPEALERTQRDSEEARDSALVPRKRYDFSPEINIYDNKIVFMSLREKFGLIIESEEIADAMKKIFELSWAEAKRLDQKTRLTRKKKRGPKN